MNTNYDLLDLQYGGRKGKTCSMTGCTNTHQRCPSLSFFRFPKEINRAKEWLIICDRPDLMRRVDLGEINVNNYYVCEQHFQNQILDYATRKILIKTATPVSITESKMMPFSAAGLMMNALNGFVKQNSQKALEDEMKRDADGSYENDDEDIEDNCEQVARDFAKALIPQVILAKEAQRNLCTTTDEDSIPDDSIQRSQMYWTPDATRLLIRLRAEREADFEQSGARKSLLWIEISDKMREAGFDFTPEKVSKKWHNIMITYNKNAEKKNGPVNWEFFDEINEIYKSRRVHDLSIAAGATSLAEEALALVNAVQLERLTSTQTRLPTTLNGDTINLTLKHKLPNSPDRSDYNGNMQRKQKKQKNTNLDYEMRSSESDSPITSPIIPLSIDENWWKEYFERKLELEREKIRKQDERHKDQMNFQKMAIMLQEKVEKIKVDAINGLTNALLRLQETRKE